MKIAIATGMEFELRTGLSTQEVEGRLHEGRRAEDVGARVVSYYLADMRQRGLHQELGFATAERFADTRLGMAPSTTRERIATSRALDELPALDRAFGARRLGWSVVRQLARIATPETEAAWASWAEHRTAREVARHTKSREKGQLPTDSARRRIHTSKFAVSAELDVVQWETWTNARTKLEAEQGCPLSDAEVLLEAANLVLQSRPDGTVPGRSAVNDSHFAVHVSHCEACRKTQLRTEEEDVELAPAEARDVLEKAGRGDLVVGSAEDGDGEDGGDDDGDDEHENTGPTVPSTLRDGPNTDALRQSIVVRDGGRCRCCGAKSNLTVHHKQWREYGGRTEESNCILLCEGCHSLVHDRLLVARGRVPDRLRFYDRRGRALRSRGEAANGAGSRLVDAPGRSGSAQDARATVTARRPTSGGRSRGVGPTPASAALERAPGHAGARARPGQAGGRDRAGPSAGCRRR